MSLPRGSKEGIRAVLGQTIRPLAPDSPNSGPDKDPNTDPTVQLTSSHLLAFLVTPQKHLPSPHPIHPTAALQYPTPQSRRDVVQGSKVFGQVRIQCLEYNIFHRGEDSTLIN